MGGLAQVATAASGPMGSALSTVFEGNAQYSQAKADAGAVEANGKLKAAQIRKQGLAAKSSAMAAAAENGLDVNEGTPTVINDQIAANVESDAWMSILGANQDAVRIRVAGKAAQTKSRGDAAAGLIKAGTDAAMMASGMPPASALSGGGGRGSSVGQGQMTASMMGWK